MAIALRGVTKLENSECAHTPPPNVHCLHYHVHNFIGEDSSVLSNISSTFGCGRGARGAEEAGVRPAKEGGVAELLVVCREVEVEGARRKGM